MTATAKPPAQEWAWRTGFGRCGDAREIGEELSRIARKKGAEFDALTPAEVVRAAKSGRHYPALHKALYAADDAQAAFRWRVAYARKIIASLGYIVADDRDRTIHIARPSVILEGQRRYLPMPIVAGNRSLRDGVVRDCQRAIDGLKSRIADVLHAEDRPDIRAFFEAVLALGSTGRELLGEGGGGDRPRPAT